MRVLREDDGGIITGWLGNMIVFMAFFGLLIYELGSIGVTAVSLDDISRDVARAGALSYRDTRDLADAATAAEARAEALSVTIVEGPELDGGDIVLTIEKQAPTLIAQKIGFLEDLTRPAGTGRAPWDPR